VFWGVSEMALRASATPQHDDDDDDDDDHDDHVNNELLLSNRVAVRVPATSSFTGQH